MKKPFVIILFLLILVPVSHAGFLDNFLKGFTSQSEEMYE